MGLSNIIDRMEEFEPRFSTIDLLMDQGALRVGEGIIDGGDFQQTLWSHSWDGLFSVGCMERVRHNGESFPMHAHHQRQWLMCSIGSLAIRMDGNEPHMLKEGEYLVIEPDMPHELIPVSDACLVVFTTIPSDEGFDHVACNRRTA